jgi:hypothetical protein
MATDGNLKPSPVLVSILSVLFLAVLACGGYWFYINHRPAPPPSPPPVATLQYNTNVKKIDEKPLKITNNEVIFAGNNHDISNGTVLLSNVRRYGYSRKVEAVKIVNGKTVCNTAPATLTDTFKSLPPSSFKPEFDSNTITLLKKQKVPGLSFKWVTDPKTHVDPLEIDFSGMSDGPVSITGHATIDPHTQFDTDTDVNGTTQLFEATYDSDVSGSVTIQANATGNFNSQPNSVYNYPVGPPIPDPSGLFWAVPRLEIYTSGVKGDLVSKWKRTESIDVKAHAALGYNLSTGWSGDQPTCTINATDSHDDVKGSFYVQVTPVKIRLIYAIYLFDPTNAYYAPSDGDDEFGPYLDMEGDILLHGKYQSSYSSVSGKTQVDEDFLVRGEVQGTLGNEYGNFDNAISDSGLIQIIHPLTVAIYGPLIYENTFAAPPGFSTASGQYEYYHYGHRKHHRRFNDRYIDAYTSYQIKEGAEVLKSDSWHDPLGVVRDSQVNHVTIANDPDDAVKQKINTFSQDSHQVPDSIKNSVANNVFKLHHDGNALLNVRNRIADVGFRRASNGDRIRLYRRVRWLTREIRHYNSASKSLENQVAPDSDGTSSPQGQN